MALRSISPRIRRAVVPGRPLRAGSSIGITALVAVLLGIILCLPLLHHLHHTHCLEPATCPYHLLQSGFIVACWLGGLALLLLTAYDDRLHASWTCPSPQSLPAFTFTRRGPPRY